MKQKESTNLHADRVSTFQWHRDVRFDENRNKLCKNVQLFRVNFILTYAEYFHISTRQPETASIGMIQNV